MGNMIDADHVGEVVEGDGVDAAGPTGGSVTGADDDGSWVVGAVRGGVVTGITLANGRAVLGQMGWVVGWII